MSETTDELRPIGVGEEGFMRNVHALFGSSADWSPLADRAIDAVEVTDDKEALVIRLTDGRTLTYRTVGDCCSNSWVEHLTVPPDIKGTVATGVKDGSMGEFDEDYSTIRVYQTALVTPKGEIIIEYRNSSNGYYGGWLEGPTETWPADERASESVR